MADECFTYANKGLVTKPMGWAALKRLSFFDVAQRVNWVNIIALSSSK
jgi:hypothetical protein